MYKKFGPIILLLALMPSTGLAETLTLQPSISDAYLEQWNPTTNNGTGTEIRLTSWTGGARRSILAFDGITDIPADATIDDATLSVYYFAWGTSDPVGKNQLFYKLDRNDWVESQATWNVYSTGNSWASAGGDYSTMLSSSTIPASVGNWVSVDITSYVASLYASSTDEANLLMRFATENTGDTTARYYSREYTGDTSLTPKLVINYSTSTPPATEYASSSLSEATEVCEELSLATSTMTFCYRPLDTAYLFLVELVIVILAVGGIILFFKVI